MSKLRNIFNNVVNINHWFTYGRAWLMIPFTIMNSSSTIAIFLIFFDLQGETLLLIGITFISVVGSLILGIILFFKKGQQTDLTMATWRNPIPQLGYITNIHVITGLAIKYDLEFPEAVKKFGLTEWKDLYYVWEYILNKGEAAKAQEICKEFFKEMKKNE